jgi:glutamate 5-kinase
MIVWHAKQYPTTGTRNDENIYISANNEDTNRTDENLYIFTNQCYDCRMRDSLKNCKKIVVKIGSSSLTLASGVLDTAFIEMFARDVSDVLGKDSDRRVAVVTSGAVAAGMSLCGVSERPANINQLQALSSLGQSALMQHYSRAFDRYAYRTAQLLLTQNVVSEKSIYANARRTFESLFTDFARVVPIINENDAISVEGIRFSDNDTLAAHVATLIEADLLVVISDVDGIYTADPSIDADATKISVINKVDLDTLKYVSPSKSKLGTGGMKTKLIAAQIANKAAIPMVLASYKDSTGATPYGSAAVVSAILSGENIGSLFLPDTESPLGQRKHWLAFGSKECGSIMINDGAKEALLERKTSLLPAGIVAVDGEFDKDDIVFVISENGEKIAKGIVEYSSADVEKIKGLHSSKIAETLDLASYSDEVINRTNMVTMEALITA